MTRFRPVLDSTGAVFQAAMPKVSKIVRESAQESTLGLLLRGVVIATYVYDEDSAVASGPTAGVPQFNIYCDVFCYTGIPNFRNQVLPRCLVLQRSGGMHDGEIWKPRATTRDITGTDLNINEPGKSDPFDWDGDHVLVGFMDDSFNLPVILGSVPHPEADVGKVSEGDDAEEVGARMRLRTVDGNPRMWKHKGVFWGVDADGGWRLDLRNANDGEHNADGTEKAAPEDGSVGNYTAHIQKGARGQVNGPEGQVVTLLADGAISIRAATGDQTIRLDPDGTVLIDGAMQQSSIELSASGKIQIIAGNDAAEYEVNASKANFRTDTVDLGDGADEKVVLGSTWKTDHDDYDAKLRATMAQLAILLPFLAAGVVPPVVISVGPDGIAFENLTTPGKPGSIADLLVSISFFTTGFHLSDSVKTRT